MKYIRVVREVTYAGEEDYVLRVLKASLPVKTLYLPDLKITIIEKERTVLDGPQGI